VSNGDAFNTPHNPGFSSSVTDNAYITDLKAKNGGKNPYTSQARLLSLSEYKKHSTLLTKDEWIAIAKDMIKKAEVYNSKNYAWEVPYDVIYRGYMLQIVDNLEVSLSKFADAKFKNGLFDSIGLTIKQDDAAEEYLVAQSSISLDCLKAAMALNYDPDDWTSSAVKK